MSVTAVSVVAEEAERVVVMVGLAMVTVNGSVPQALVVPSLLRPV